MNRGTQTTSNQRVAANVRRLLDENGMTRESFANRMKMSRTTAWKRLKGIDWDLDEVDAVARIFNVQPDDLTCERVSA